MPPKPLPTLKPTRQPPTHFLCIPLSATPASRAQLAASLSAFRTDVCGPPALGGLDLPGDAVRPVGTVHLTLGVMSFPSGSSRLGALKIGSASEARSGGVGLGVVSGVGSGAGLRGTGGGQDQGEAETNRGEDGGEGEGEGRIGDGESGKVGLVQAIEVLRGLRLKEIWRGVCVDMAGRSGQGQAQGGDKGATGAGLDQGVKGQRAGEGDAGGQTALVGAGEGEEQPQITLRGLSSMQPANRAAVLYAPPIDQRGLLQVFCERVRNTFVEAKLMVDEGRPLLLHATVVNTIYVNGKKRGEGSSRGRRGRGGRGGKKWERLVFDATGIIDRYEDQVWMEDVPVEKVAICKMGAKKLVVNGEEDEAYEVEAEVLF